MSSLPVLMIMMSSVTGRAHLLLQSQVNFSTALTHARNQRVFWLACRLLYNLPDHKWYEIPVLLRKNISMYSLYWHNLRGLKRTTFIWTAFIGDILHGKECKTAHNFGINFTIFFLQTMSTPKSQLQKRYRIIHCPGLLAQPPECAQEYF